MVMSYGTTGTTLDMLGLQCAPSASFRVPALLDHKAPEND